MRLIKGIDGFVGSAILITGIILFWPSVWSIVTLVYASICALIAVYLIGVEKGKKEND